MKTRQFSRPLLFLLLVGLAVPGVASAYLDPGTGSFILQMLVGAVLGGLVAIGVFWKRVLGFLKRLFGKGKEAPPGGDTGGDDKPRTD